MFCQIITGNRGISTILSNPNNILLIGSGGIGILACIAITLIKIDRTSLKRLGYWMNRKQQNKLVQNNKLIKYKFLCVNCIAKIGINDKYC